MGKYVYVDNSNLFIEGMRVSAVQGGRASNVWDAAKKEILDELYRIDFGKLHNILADGNPSNILKAVLFGSRPPANDSLWKMAEKAGFKTTIEDRNVAGQEKRVDTGIVTAIMADAYTIIKKVMMR